MVSRWVNSPHKKGPISLWLGPHMALKFPSSLCPTPGPINMTTMIKQHTKFPPTASPPGQTYSPGYTLPQNQLWSTNAGKRH